MENTQLCRHKGHIGSNERNMSHIWIQRGSVFFCPRLLLLGVTGWVQMSSFLQACRTNQMKCDLTLWPSDLPPINDQQGQSFGLNRCRVVLAVVEVLLHGDSPWVTARWPPCWWTCPCSQIPCCLRKSSVCWILRCYRGRETPSPGRPEFGCWSVLIGVRALG